MKTTHNPNGTWISVTGEKEAFPPVFLGAATRARQQVAFRLAGGCSGMSEEQRRRVCQFFVEALPGYGGVAISGATDSPDGLPMVTNVPAALAEAHGAIALGTCPRTHDMALPDAGSVAVSKYGDTIDRGQHAVVVVQRDAANVLDWDGDLDPYLDFLTGLRDEAGWACAVLFFNGGGVTRDEFLLALDRNLPLVVIRGSGRFADVLTAQWGGQDLAVFDEKTRGLALSDEQLANAKESGLVNFATFDEPNTLNDVARSIGLLSS